MSFLCAKQCVKNTFISQGKVSITTPPQISVKVVIPEQFRSCVMTHKMGILAAYWFRKRKWEKLENYRVDVYVKA